MNKLVSARLAELRQKLRQFEHGGHCFGSEEMSGLVGELSSIITAARAMEDEVAGARRRADKAAPRPNAQPARAARPAVPIGTFYFVPTHHAGGEA